jgi:hypothetical protein
VRKTGCRIEARRLKTIERLEAALTLYSATVARRGRPGPHVLWRGFQRLHHITDMFFINVPPDAKE